MQDRKALVTGADSGIGRAAAIAYAREGADVALSYLPDEQQDAEEVAKLVEQAGRKAVLLPGDISNEAFSKNWWRMPTKPSAGWIFWHWLPGNR